MTNAWYCAQTDSRVEFKIQGDLREVAINCYVPTLVKWKRHQTNRHSRRTSKEKRPVFPRYIFVQADDEQRPGFVSEVNNMRGVIRILSNDFIPIKVPNAEIAKLMKAEADGKLDMTKDPFQPGQRVRVTEGPLANEFGVFLRQGSGARVEVLLAMMGGTRSKLGLDQIEGA